MVLIRRQHLETDMGEVVRFIPKSDRGKQHLETNMGEVVRFISKSDRERLRLTREARAICDSVFRPADPADEQQDVAPISRANPFCSDEVLS
jgi:hypothetical protein